MNPANTAASATSGRLERLGTYLQQDPDNPTLLRDYAWEAWQRKEPEAACMALERLADAGQALPGDRALHAAVLRANGQREAAMAVLTEARSRWPDDPAVAIEYARGLFADRHFEAALAALPVDVPDSATAARACALRVQLLHHLGQVDDAASTAEAFLSTQFADAEVAASVIPVLLDLDRLEDASSLAHGLVSAGIKAYAAYEALAADALHRNAAAEALQWTDQALSVRRDDGRMWLLRGMGLLRTGDEAGATAALETAVALQPRHAGSHLALGWLHVLQRRADAAVACFEQALAVSPSFSESHGSLAVIAAMEGQPSKAGELIRKARRLEANSATAQYAQALLDGAVPAEIEQLAQALLARLGSGGR